MSGLVYETILSHLPHKRKTTPSGWTSFNAPCCVHNGTSADTRQRGGLIKNGDDGVSYHCFNCGFKASWNKGRKLSWKMRRFLEWLGASDDVINKLALAVLQFQDKVDHTQIVELPKFNEVPLPDSARELSAWDDYKALEPTGMDSNLVKIYEYLKERNLNTDDYTFYWTPELGYRDRVIIPFYHENKIVGWTARTILPNKQPKYLSEQQPGYVFNLDSQHYNRLFTIVVEGPIDAIHVDGVALMGSEVKDAQALLLKSLNKEVILVPDRDEKGKQLIDRALELGWSVSMPNWSDDIKDVNDAVQKYGRVYTLHSIVLQKESNELKIKLRSKQWFG